MKTKRNACRLALSVLAAAVVIGGLASVPAAAQVRPALVKDVENPSQNPWWSVGHDYNTQGIVNFFVFLDMVGPEIPEGKRLTLEFVSVICTTPADDSIYDVRISVFKANGTSMQYPLLINKQGTDYEGRTTWVASQPVRLYLDHNSYQNQLYLNVHHKNWNDASNTTSCVADVSGSLVSLQ